MKKILLILMVIGLLTVAIAGCGGTGIIPADADVEPHPMPEVDPIGDGQDLNGNDELNPELDDGANYGDEGQQEFISVSGIVVSMEIINDLRHVEIEDAEGNTAILVLSDETVFPFSTDFAVGDEVTGWYCATSPMIMIYPPQYTILVFSSRMGDDRNITVDRFNASDISHAEYLISQDGMFAFTTDENTEIILADGQDFSDGELEGRRIVVIYGASTKGIPELATASKLIVLFETAVPFA